MVSLCDIGQFHSYSFFQLHLGYTNVIMKRVLLPILLLLPMLLVAKSDSTIFRKTELVKKGWNIGPIPIIAFDSDLGLEYGALFNFYNYGDGSMYPRYKHSVYLEVARYTKGSGKYEINFDSRFVIPGIRLTADLTYQPNLAAEFFGFNGAESIYTKGWTKPSNADYHSEVFYKMNKDMLRASLDFQGKVFPGSKFGWLLGAAFVKYNVGSVNVGKLDVAASAKYDASTVLYNKYVEWGIIKDWEAHGGSHVALKGGVVFDTRDNEPNPMSGVWADALVQYVTPNLAEKGRGHAKITATFRQYFTIIPNDLSFAYRIIAQNVVAGDCPFYMIPTIGTSMVNRSSFEGMGGAYSLRGIMRNRVVGNGIALANAEFRYKFWRLHLLRQNFYCAINLFGDAGMITQKVVYDRPSMPLTELSTYFSDESQRPHFSYGVGGKLAMNQNFVISGDIGKAVSSKDGTMGMYIGVNFLF
jgi:hypothetical protein